MLVIGILAILPTACISKKKIAQAKKEYQILQFNLDSLTTIPQAADRRINPFDEIQVLINTLSIQKDQAEIFGGGKPMSFQVDSAGNIFFPVLNTLNVKGKTTSELSEMLTEKLSKFIKEPIVQSFFMPITVSVTGEVLKPGMLTLPNNNPTLINALSISGGMNMDARRDSILIIKSKNGIAEKRYVDLRDANSVFAPEHYFLQQNDIVVVQPNKTFYKNIKNREIGSDAAAVGKLTTLMSIGFFAISIVNFFITVTR